MSAPVLELEGTAAEIRAQLPEFSSQRLHVTIRPVTPEPAEEDEGGQAWMAGISREWEADWLDPREDIYSLEDGEPLHAAR